MGFETALSIIAIIIATVSVYFSARSARHARDAVVGTMIMELLNSYDQEEMKEGVRYLFNLRNENYDDFRKNPYAFAREYLDNVDESSKEWYHRRVVVLFWSRIGVMLKTGVLSEDIAFTLFPNVEVIEILEPIEVALVDKYGGMGDQYIPLVYRRWEKWKKKEKFDEDMQLPLDPEAYSASKKRSTGTETDTL
jgi:hypothetical protein